MTAIFGALSLAERGLGYHMRRHQLLVSNIANAKTPGYVPRELRFREALEAAGSLSRTHARHAGAAGALGAAREDVYDDAAITPSPDGNAVSTERQLAKLSANSLRFRATSEMLSRRMALLRYAANDGR
jgi:flagellar basal-body rod protein FlgB